MKIEFKVSFKWWVIPYIYAIGLFCWFFKREPDFNKLEKLIEKGTILELIKNDHKDIF